MKYYLDGQLYNTRDEAPDLGSLTSILNEDGTRSYSGNNADFKKLPIYPDLKAGSDATLSDEAGLYVYHFNGIKWNKA